MKKIIIISLLIFISSNILFAQQTNYQLSSHILDISKGMPAPNVKITLQKQIQGNQWEILAEKQTDKNGRVSDFLPQTDGVDHIGVYKLIFNI